MIKEEDVYQIGYIHKPHGLQGEVNFHFTDFIFDEIDSPFLLIEIDSIIVPFLIEDYRFRSDSVAIMKFEGIDNQEEAKTLTGCPVYIERRYMEDLPIEDLSYDYYVGFKMIDTRGKEIGKITSLDTQTENYLFIVERSDGNSLMVPVNEEWIEMADNVRHELTVSLPEGLLTLN